MKRASPRVPLALGPRKRAVAKGVERRLGAAAAGVVAASGEAQEERRREERRAAPPGPLANAATSSPRGAT